MTSILLAALALAPVQMSVRGRPARVSATSQLAAKNPSRYAAKNAFDGDRETAWVEGAPGVGEGEALIVLFDKPVELSGFLLVAGYARSARTLLENAAPSALDLLADGKKIFGGPVPWAMHFPDGGQECRLVDHPLNFAPRMLVLARTVTARKFELRIASAVKGTKFEDTAITEFWPILRGVAAEIGEESYEDVHSALASLREGRTPLLARGVEAPGKALLDTLVTIAGTDEARVVVGAVSSSEGDGEWVEHRPVLHLDAQGRIASVQTVDRKDGAPGCHDALPEEVR